MINKITLLLMLYVSNAVAECSNSLKHEIVDISSNGQIIIAYKKDENCFKVISQNNKIQFKKIPGLDKVNYVNKQIEVEISDDAKLILIGYNTSESSRHFTLYNSKDLEPIKEFNASYARILKDSERVVFIDDYNVEDNTKPNGINIYNIKNNSIENLFNEMIFTGPLTIRGTWIITETSPTSNINSERIIRIINLESKTQRSIE